MGIKIDVIVDIDPNLMSSRTEQADEILATQAKSDTEQFVPALTGSLTMRTRVDGASIIYPGPYARYLWEGKVMVDSNTGSAWAKPGATKVATGKNLVFTQTMHGQAQSHWFDASKAVNLEKWIRVYGKAVTRGQ